MSDYSSDDEAEDVHRDPITHRPLNPRRILFEPVIGRVVDALGGYEAGVYRMGDEVSGCLKDLKKLWRKDDTDDERTVARIFWEKRVLSKDLIPILLMTAGAGQVEDKRAIACADLISAMTWPIDMSEELAELDSGERADFTQLHAAHRSYKAAVLQPAVIQALFAIILPPLAKIPKERSLRDNQVAALVLYIVRNLAAIRDRDGLQSRLLTTLRDNHLFELILTAASNSEKDPLLGSWNTLILEILFLLFRGTPPMSLIDQPKPALERLLAAEARAAPVPTSRHSRFGTSIVVSANPKATTQAVVHTTAPVPFLLDANKKRVRVRAVESADAIYADDLTIEALSVLRGSARDFLSEGVFNAFLTALLRDIKMERSWATGDRIGIWTLAVVRWTTCFFLLDTKVKKRDFGLVGAAVESGFVSWVLKRMREASEEKPVGWPAMFAGMGCLTQILSVLDAIASPTSGATESDADAAQTLTMQLIYAGAPLDLAMDCLRACTTAKAAGRGPAFLDAAVHFAYSLVRMLERQASTGDSVYVRKAKSSAKKGNAEDETQYAEEEERRRAKEEQEQTFSLDSFEMRFANAEITRALLLQLGRFKDLESDALRRVVSLLHRVAVRAKAEGLFFNVSTLYLFQKILGEQKALPRDQPHRDLVSLVTFVLRRFFKALAEDSFLAVEAFFPKNRGQWKSFSSWEPPTKGEREQTRTIVTTEIKVKKGYSWSEQVGIAIAALVESGEVGQIEWVITALATVVLKWRKVAEEVDKNATGTADSESDDEQKVRTGHMERGLDVRPEVQAAMVDFQVPFPLNEMAEAFSTNPRLQLLMRLVKFVATESGPDVTEWEWTMPKEVPPAELERMKKVIEQFLETPINLQGKKASELMTKTSQRRRRSPSPSASESGSESSGGQGEFDDKKNSKKKKGRKARTKDRSENTRKERQQQEYKSAQFIEDSDEEYGDIDAFLEKEKVMRERILLQIEKTGMEAPMQKTGTKKRRKKDGLEGSKRKKKRPDEEADDVFESQPVAQTRPRPKPKPIFKAKADELPVDSTMDVDEDSQHDSGSAALDAADPDSDSACPRRRPRRTVAISDDDDDVDE